MTFRRAFPKLFLGLVFLVSCRYASADPMAAVNFSGFGFNSGSTDTSATVGWSFTVSEALTVSSLGYFDLGANGLGESHGVAIWTGAGTLLTSATVPSGTAGTLLNSFRYVAISPLILNPGAYVIGGGNALAVDTFVGIASGFSASPLISFTAARGIDGSLEFPTISNPAFNPGFFGPNMLITAAAVPEPSNLILFGTGLIALVGLTVKRSMTRG